jgi:hypothetical protein
MNTERDMSVNKLTVILAITMTALLIGLAAGCGGELGAGDDTLDTSQFAARGVPSGAHFNLNIIGVPKGKTASGTGANGRVIHVPLAGSTKILLSEGEFQVLDSNGTDGSAAFQLPNPDPTNSGTTTYSVFARALGKPGGSSTTTTCATDVATGEVFCSVFTSVLTRSKGGSTFTNVSRELLYIFADVDGDGIAERQPLFGDGLTDFFWQYDNAGLKLAQLRFYEVPTTVQ